MSGHAPPNLGNGSRSWRLPETKSARGGGRCPAGNKRPVQINGAVKTETF
jgi:hypothetical protein